MIKLFTLGSRWKVLLPYPKFDIKDVGIALDGPLSISHRHQCLGENLGVSS